VSQCPKGLSIVGVVVVIGVIGIVGDVGIILHGDAFELKLKVKVVLTR